MTSANRPKGSHFRQRFYGKHVHKEEHPSPNFRRLETYAHNLVGKKVGSGQGLRILGETPKVIRGQIYSSLMGRNAHPYRDILLLEMMVLFAHHHSLTNTELRKQAQESLNELGIYPPKKEVKK